MFTTHRKRVTRVTDLTEQSVMDALEEIEAGKELNVAGGHEIVWLLDEKGVIIGFDGPRHLPYEGHDDIHPCLREVH